MFTDYPVVSLAVAVSFLDDVPFPVAVAVSDPVAVAVAVAVAVVVSDAVAVVVVDVAVEKVIRLPFPDAVAVCYFINLFLIQFVFRR